MRRRKHNCFQAKLRGKKDTFAPLYSSKHMQVSHLLLSKLIRFSSKRMAPKVNREWTFQNSFLELFF